MDKYQEHSRKVLTEGRFHGRVISRREFDMFETYRPELIADAIVGVQVECAGKRTEEMEGNIMIA